MKKFIVAGLVLSLVLMPVVALALGPGEPRSAETILKAIQTWLTTIVGIIAAIFLIVGGLMYITAGGDQNRIAAAKATLTNAVIGIIIILLANSIIYIIRMALGYA